MTQPAILGGSVYPQYPVRSTIMLLGDSELAGSNASGETGMVGIARSWLYLQLRQWRSDFDFIGPQATLMEQTPTPLPFNMTTPGHLMATVANDLKTAVAAVGTPNILIVWSGGGDITAGRSFVQMQADWATMVATIQAQCPNATVVITGIPGFVAGTTTGSNVAAWNAQAASFRALQQQTCVANGWIYTGILTGMSVGEFEPDGAHVNQGGQAQWGQQMATIVDQVIGRPRKGVRFPRAFLQRQPWQGVQVTTPTTDGFTIANTATGLNPGTGSYICAWDFYPTALDTTTRAMAVYGTHATNPFWSVWLINKKINVYWNDSGAGTLFSTSNPQTSACLDMVPILNQWNRFVVWAYLAPGASTGTIALYVNGNLAGLALGVPAWNFGATQVTTFGTYAGNPGIAGYYSRVHAYQGTLIPPPGTMAALLGAENDYYGASSIVEGAGSAMWDLNGTLAPETNGQPSAVLVGSAAFVTAAYAGGSLPLRPWEFGYK